MELIRVGQDTTTLVDEMLPAFKEHLRILHDIEDESIKGYLGASIDAIGIYMGTEIFSTQFEVFYPMSEPNYRVPSTLLSWYSGRWNISNVSITNAGGTDVTAEYIIHSDNGKIHPHPLGRTITLNTGYLSKDEIPYNLRNIIYRLGADFYENREAIRVGEPKALPMWIEYSMASIWMPRV